MKTYDSWHTLDVDEDGGLAISGHGRCPSYPDGPGSTAFACLTYANIKTYGASRYPVLRTLQEGKYRIRHWFEGDIEDGLEVVVVL